MKTWLAAVLAGLISAAIFYVYIQPNLTPIQPLVVSQSLQNQGAPGAISVGAPGVDNSSTLRSIPGATGVGDQNRPTIVPDIIDLSSIFNYPLDYLIAGPGVGQHSWQGIPYQVTPRMFESQHELRENLPVEATVRKNVASPYRIHVFMVGGYVEPQQRDQKVGEIRLQFQRGQPIVTPIIAYQNIREGWQYVAAPADQTRMESPNCNCEWNNVYTESQERNGQAAYGFLDMVTIPIPVDLQSDTLVSVTFVDTSLQTIHSIDPGLMVIALTIDQVKQ